MTPNLDKYLSALGLVESSNNYKAVGPTHPKYGRPLGYSQVMESNLPSWSQAALGRTVTPDEYLNDPTIQQAVTKHRFGQLVQQYGNVPDAVSAWHSGRPLAEAQGAKDSLGTKTPDYVNKIMAAADGAPQGDPQADLPALDAAETQGPSMQAPSGFEAFLQGGPGALFGMPQKDWSGSDALIGAGAALMARDNPKGASALAALKGTGTKTAANKSVVRTDSKTGQVTVYDPASGTFQTQQVFDREPEQPKDATRKQFQTNSDLSNVYGDMADKFRRYRDLIADGKMDLSILESVDKTVNELRNKPLTEAQRNAVAFGLDMENMRNAKLLEAKGVQTEGDAERAMNSILPKTGRYNNDSVLEALEAGYKNSVKNYSNTVKNNEAMYNKFGDNIAYMGYKDAIVNRQKGFDEDEKTFAPKREAYRKRREEENKAAPLSSDAVPGRVPSNNNNNSSSFYEHMKRGRQ